MDHIENIKDILSLQQNQIISPGCSEDNQIIMKDSQIIFKGKNNIVYLEKSVHLVNSRISFEGDNNLVYLSSSKHNYLLNLTLYNQSSFFMGKDNYINGKINAILSEQKHILIGNDGLFSFGIWMRLADPHLIYDCRTHQRKNPSKSIFLGDHVWIGQNALILKGTHVGSGSILGANSVISGKIIPSNTSWAGNPAREIANNIFFTSPCVHGFTSEKTRESQIYMGDEYIYCNPSEKDRLNFNTIDKDLSLFTDAPQRLEYLKTTVQLNTCKNRFAIISQPSQKNRFFKIK